MKLTNTLRDTIINTIVEQTTAKDRARLKKQEHIIGMAAYAKLYTKAERDAIAGLPEGWVAVDDCLRFNIGGMDMRFDVEKAMPVKVAGQSYCRRLGDIADEKIKIKALALHSMQESLKEKAAKIKAQARGVLYSVQTYKQLTESWPEGKKYYASYAPKKPESMLPAIQVSTLNETLGLKDKAA